MPTGLRNLIMAEKPRELGLLAALLGASKAEVPVVHNIENVARLLGGVGGGFAGGLGGTALGHDASRSTGFDPEAGGLAGAGAGALLGAAVGGRGMGALQRFLSNRSYTLGKKMIDEYGKTGLQPLLGWTGKDKELEALVRGHSVVNPLSSAALNAALAPLTGGFSLVPAAAQATLGGAQRLAHGSSGLARLLTAPMNAVSMPLGYAAGSIGNAVGRALPL